MTGVGSYGRRGGSRVELTSSAVSGCTISASKDAKHQMIVGLMVV